MSSAGGERWGAGASATFESSTGDVVASSVFLPLSASVLTVRLRAAISVRRLVVRLKRGNDQNPWAKSHGQRQENEERKVGAHHRPLIICTSPTARSEAGGREKLMESPSNSRWMFAQGFTGQIEQWPEGSYLGGWDQICDSDYRTSLHCRRWHRHSVVSLTTSFVGPADA